MAKLKIEVDTESKAVSVKVGKQTIDNVSYVGISTEEGGYFYVDISTNEEMDGMRKTTRLSASAKDADWQERPEEVDTKALASVLLQREVE